AERQATTIRCWQQYMVWRGRAATRLASPHGHPTKTGGLGHPGGNAEYFLATEGKHAKKSPAYGHLRYLQHRYRGAILRPQRVKRIEWPRNDQQTRQTRQTEQSLRHRLARGTALQRNCARGGAATPIISNGW